jgi:hypothetical protein
MLGARASRQHKAYTVATEDDVFLNEPFLCCDI